MTDREARTALARVIAAAHGATMRRAAQAVREGRCCALALFAAAWLAVALTDFRPRLRVPVEPSAIPQRASSDGRAASCPTPHVRPPV